MSDKHSVPSLDFHLFTTQGIVIFFGITDLLDEDEGKGHCYCFSILFLTIIGLGVIQRSGVLMKISDYHKRHKV